MKQVSRGTEPVEYSLHVLAHAGDGQGFNSAKIDSFQIGPVSFNVAFEERSLTFTATCKTEEKARKAFTWLLSCAAFLAIRYGIEISLPSQLSSLQRAPGDDELLAFYNNCAVIYPEHKRVLRIDGGFLYGAYKGIDTEKVLEAIRAETSACNVELPANVLLAASLYARARHSDSVSLGLLLAVIGLEAVCPSAPRADAYQKAIDELLELIDGLEYLADAEDREWLKRHILNGKKEGRAQAVRRRVAMAFSSRESAKVLRNRFKTIDECNRAVSDVYDGRSQLSHAGRFESKKRSLGDLRQDALALLAGVLSDEMSGGSDAR